ncbi:MAG: hypothetical protein ACO37V_07510 [Ilumatobacteraceae bacterium]
MKRIFAVFCAVSAVGVVGCTSNGGEADGVDEATCDVTAPVEGRDVRIVTTVAPITSLVAQVVGDAGPVIVGLVPEGTNSHTF